MRDSTDPRPRALVCGYVGVGGVRQEKLILKNLVRKHSRKVTAAVCLLLAVKFNEVPKDPRLDALQACRLRLPPAACHCGAAIAPYPIRWHILPATRRCPHLGLSIEALTRAPTAARRLPPMLPTAATAAAAAWQPSMQGEGQQNRVVFIACNDSRQSLPADLLRHLHHLLAKPEVRLAPHTHWAPCLYTPLP